VACLTGVCRICFPNRVHDRGGYEDHCLRVRSSSGCLSSQRLEHLRFYNSSYRVSSVVVESN